MQPTIEELLARNDSIVRSHYKATKQEQNKAHAFFIIQQIRLGTNKKEVHYYAHQH